MLTTDQIKYLLNLPPEEIIRWFYSKGYTFSWDWKEVYQSAHQKTFTVAKVMKLDILQEIKNATDKIFSQGITYEQFVKDLEPTLKRLGWWGKVRAADVPGYDPARGIDPNKIVQLGSPSRLKTIFNVNSNVAYNKGRYDAMIAAIDAFPYWQYKQLERPTYRKSHHPFADKIFRADDPIWNIIYPPNGWNCGCYVKALTQSEVDSKELRIYSGADVKQYITEKAIPKEWQYNPAANPFTADLSQYDEDIVAAYRGFNG